MNGRKPTHSGEVLLEDVLKELHISITNAASNFGVSRKTLSELVNGKSSLTPEMAIRIAMATNTSPESWMNMLTKYDLWKIQQEQNLRIVPFKTYVA